MTTKNVLMGYSFIYALIRFGLTTYQYFTGSVLHLPVLIIAEAVSLAGIIAGIFWFMKKMTPALLRGLLALNAAAMIANLIITRQTPPSTGAHTPEVIIMGSLADLIILVIALLLPMRENTAPAQKTE